MLLNTSPLLQNLYRSEEKETKPSFLLFSHCIIVLILHAHKRAQGVHQISPGVVSSAGICIPICQPLTLCLFHANLDISGSPFLLKKNKTKTTKIHRKILYCLVIKDTYMLVVKNSKYGVNKINSVSASHLSSIHPPLQVTVNS